MPKGRRTVVLAPADREKLKSFRISRRLSTPVLNDFMHSPFQWETLQRAIDGKPIWDLNHQFIIDWITQNLREVPATPERE